jgi:hypothetical protein
MNPQKKTAAVLLGLTFVFALLAVAFFISRSTAVPAYPPIPLVDKSFLNVATWRKSYADLVRNKEDLSDFDCYGCHEKGKAPPLRFDANQNLIVPEEHKDIVMGHGSHGRNNNCFNCHNENNLELLSARDGREIKFSDSPQLCGSCHGPTYRDWEAGAHGRTSGYWDRSKGSIDRKLCVNCHDPHSPHFPGRQPAPGPHPLRAPAVAAATEPEPKH